MDTINKDHQQPVVNTRCPNCGGETPVAEPNNFKAFYAHCLNCNQPFVVEPIRNGIRVYTLLDVPYSIDPDCQAVEMGQCDEE